jgi:hypothetical protein
MTYVVKSPKIAYCKVFLRLKADQNFNSDKVLAEAKAAVGFISSIGVSPTYKVIVKPGRYIARR